MKIYMKKGNIIKRLIPKKVQKMLADLLGITALHERINRLEELLLESKDELWEMSRTRWRQSKPTTTLTWKREISGEDFVSKVKSFGAFDSEKTILEIGPGYGRILRSCLELKIPFKEYVAVDISKENVNYLRKTFPANSIRFVHGDIEEISFSTKFDVMLSSLTFKHLFPSFESALHNIEKYMNPGSTFFFDLLEGKKRSFEDDGITYIHQYTRSEILGILINVGLKFVAFDKVRHARNYSRLLVVAKKLK